MKTSYIVGKGPSLDFLRADDIKLGSWVYALNEAIFKVLDLGIDKKAHVLMCQMDYELGENCLPPDDRAGIFLAERCRERGIYSKQRRVHFWTPQNPSCVTAVMAIEITKYYVEPSEIVMCCFDSLATGNCEYAECIGYASDKTHKNKQRFLAQRSEIEAALGNSKTTWLIPEKR